MSGDVESRCSIYGVDHSGKVWYVNSQPNQPNGSKCVWSSLPNPTKVDIKRLTSRNGSLWGISSDHQVHVYVPKQDMPIRVRQEIYENQRWNPVEGFCNHLLPTDRPPFSNEGGTENRDKSLIKLPSDAWVWDGDWQIENTFENQLLTSEGWTYAVDFPANYVADKSWKSCVRRRKLFRYRRYIGTNKWTRIEAIHSDHTQEPFIDVSISSFGMSHPELCCVWAISIIGQIYFRAGVTNNNPEGSHWEHVEISKGLEACQVSVAANGTPFIITWTGSCLFRIGITPNNLSGTDWLEADGPAGGLLQISAGEEALWAITRDKKCWALKGDLQTAVTKYGSAFEWMEIPGKMKAISVSKSDQVVLAVNEDDNVVMSRFGITKDQKHGQGWKEAFPRVMWDTVSQISSVSEFSDLVDANGSQESLISIRPDIPAGIPIDDVEGSFANISLCWVDGGCASTLSFGNDGDLEVGPWREEILSDLQTLKAERSEFSYPNAVDASSSWSKSVRAKMFHYSKRSDSCWQSGELEIANNDTLVFHKNLQNTWMCAVQDVLSVLYATDVSMSLNLRIRNSIESGIADFVSFKFSNEKDTEEWRAALVELSAKPPEEYTLANVWLTTHSGEVLQVGQFKMADTPAEVDVITPLPDEDLKLHHPLIKGFMPGSEVKVDVSLPTSAERFTLNLNGRDMVAFHFNPRLLEKYVVRNTREKEEWGPEERDGVFPFLPGHSYSISIQCTETFFVTTVIAKHKFIFSYKHRLLPRMITNFTVRGDVNVTSVRYDPKMGDETKQVEFVTSPVPAHFWKVEAASNGFVWGLGHDLNIWSYTLNGKSNKKVEGEQNNTVTDEQAYYIYENQRWNPISGFGSHGLPTDRQPWTDKTGRIPLEKDTLKLPSSQWAWVTDWEVDYDLKEGVDNKGWQYAVDFPASYHASKRLNDFVRRRVWKRICRFTTVGPWQQLPNMKMVDFCFQMNEECEWEVVGVSQNGDAVIRCGMTPENPIGTHWEPIPNDKPFVSISGWFNQRLWAIGKDGFSYIRYQNSWQMLDRPRSSPLKSISIGPSGVWALGINNVLYRRSDIQPVFPEGREWVKACDGVLQVSLSPDGSVWALLKTGDKFNCNLAKRLGISQNNPNGIGWEIGAEGPWRHCSLAGSFSRNR